MVPPPFQFPFKSLLIKKLYHKRAWIAELKLLYLNEKMIAGRSFKIIDYPLVRRCFLPDNPFVFVNQKIKNMIFIRGNDSKFKNFTEHEIIGKNGPKLYQPHQPHDKQHIDGNQQ